MRALDPVQVGKVEGDPATDIAGGTIIFVSHDDPRDISKWSGTIYSLFRPLIDSRSGFKIRYIRGAYGGMLDLAARIVNLLCRKAGIDCRFSTAYWHEIDRRRDEWTRGCSAERAGRLPPPMKSTRQVERRVSPYCDCPVQVRANEQPQKVS